MVSLLPEDLEKRLTELEQEVRQLNRTVYGLQQELIRAGKYQREDGDQVKLLAGVQIKLQQAGEYKGREKKVRRGR